MHYFLDSAFDPNTGILHEEESRHAIKSLRLSVGDEILIGDGKGKRYTTAIKVIGKKELIVDLLSAENFEIPLPKLTIAIAPTKNPSRFEWFLEKATELGVYQIIPIETKRTERSRYKHDRAERIIHAATKQSMRAFTPVLELLTPISKVLKMEHSLKLIAHCDENTKRIELSDFSRKNSSNDILILIGPEGDFTPEEIDKSKEKGFQPVILGRNRLRTETAGVFAAAAFF
ncbi:16S rRNA (uracil(1498)-N(3))-methyltransferase [Cryomorpha ignava]|uniref:Ribosomal RNA small subunit methyltransferase E n=1 Tax=Cryomorpha ignava TaxID=101383 RepID=A0A7K3WUP4_9FLAO|nr:RsmE family RNA methyltransferase [Cryomorpha ignava]NEN25216.1 16S rRNA (uracil(1498)-N(3))-methyltransferase [Cryomorpha ignava]